MMTTIKAYLTRFYSSDEGTLSKLIINNPNEERFFECYTIELPWRNNQRNKSCIPKGTYLCTYRISNKFGQVYYLHDVPNRSAILIHPGNWAGDTEKGFKTNSYGCILVGQKYGRLYDQLAVFPSRSTLLRLIEYTEREPFLLTISGCVG